MKQISTLVISILISYVSFCQSKTVFVGFIKDAGTKEAVPYISVTNLSTGKTVMANRNGVFKLQASINDLISFAAIHYTFDTLRINADVVASDSLRIFLRPLTHQLKSVTVKTKSRYNQYQLDSIERRKDFFKGKSDHSIPVVSQANSGAGIALDLDHFYGREKRKRGVIRLFGQIENDYYINYRYNLQLINKYTTFNDDSLQLFLQQSRPTYQWLRKHTTEEDLMLYINDQLKVFFKEKE